MTKTERRKLAKEARKLAMECAVGTAPEFETGRLFYGYDPHQPACVLGHVYFRFHGEDTPPHWLVEMRDEILPVLEVLVEGNNTSQPEERKDAVVFPLLAVADALEGK